jgi:hypothetical protein
MNRLHRTLFAASLAFCLNLPFTAAAEDAVPDAAVPPMHTMHDLMREMRQEKDPEKCKTQAQAAAEPAAVMSTPCNSKRMLSEEPCRQGGAGRAPCKEEGKPGCKPGNCMHDVDKPCMQGGHKGCRMQGGDDDARLTDLEKRMDMMQLMLEMMLRSAGGSR